MPIYRKKDHFKFSSKFLTIKVWFLFSNNLQALLPKLKLFPLCHLENIYIYYSAFGTSLTDSFMLCQSLKCVLFISAMTPSPQFLLVSYLYVCLKITLHITQVPCTESSWSLYSVYKRWNLRSAPIEGKVLRSMECLSTPCKTYQTVAWRGILW